MQSGSRVRYRQVVQYIGPSRIPLHEQPREGHGIVSATAPGAECRLYWIVPDGDKTGGTVFLRVPPDEVTEVGK